MAEQSIRNASLVLVMTLIFRIGVLAQQTSPKVVQTIPISAASSPPAQSRSETPAEEKTRTQRVQVGNIKIPVFRIGGMQRSTQPLTPKTARFPAPPALTFTEKTAILKTLGSASPGSLYVKLTPGQLDVPSRGSLTLNARNSTVEKDKVTWFPQSELNPNPTIIGSVELMLYPAIGEHSYLVDCAVAGSSIQLLGPDYTETYSFGSDPSNPGSGHIFFKIDSNITYQGLVPFTITGSNFWIFYSCEVTNL